MKKKLALLLMVAMAISSLLVGCDETTPNTTETESETESSTATQVDITKLYEKGEYEGTDLSKYVTLGKYEGLLTVKESDYTVTEEDVQKEIDAYREAYAEVKEEKDRVAQDGDVVNIDYVGRIYGIKFIGGTSEDFDLELGSDTFIDGFEDGLIGVKAGDKLDVVVTFPSDYEPDPELAGKEATFSVTVNSVSVKVLPEFNDEFVDELTDGQIPTAAEFSTYIRQQIEVEKKMSILDNYLIELRKNATFTEESEKVVEDQYEEVIAYYEEYAKTYGYTLEAFAKLMGYESEQELKDEIKEDTDVEAKNLLVLYAYGAAIEVDMSDESVLEAANALAVLNGHDDAKSLLAQYAAAMIREDIYKLKIAEIIIANNK